MQLKPSEQKHSDILKAAIDEFKQHGFESARTTSIAKNANVSSRTLYKHFSSKEALFNAIVEIVIAETGSIAVNDFNPERPMKDQLLEALSTYIQAITDDTYLGLNRMIMSEYLRDPALAERIFARAEMRHNPVKTIVSGAMDHGLLRVADPQYATEQLTASAKAFFFWPKFLVGQDVGDEPQEILEDCVAMFLAHYGKNNVG